jgi:hypothetical protein
VTFVEGNVPAYSLLSRDDLAPHLGHSELIDRNLFPQLRQRYDFLLLMREP